MQSSRNSNKSSKRFTLRIETHATASEKIVSDINHVLEACGFSRRVTTSTGRRLLLPTSEFRISSRSTCTAIRNLARKALDAAGHDCAIFVTQGICRWHNLKLSNDLN